MRSDGQSAPLALKVAAAAGQRHDRLAVDLHRADHHVVRPAQVGHGDAGQDGRRQHGRLVDAQEVSWQEINLQLLAQNPEFLAIGA